MRLLNTTTLLLQDFFRGDVPPYAILSHTWEDDEPSYAEWIKSECALIDKAGYKKVARCCGKALESDFQWIWIDTICIDKSEMPSSSDLVRVWLADNFVVAGSSAELSEAINSMFTWYQGAQICYAYLQDVIHPDNVLKSRWWTRGWTLQELLAPSDVIFFNQAWEELGTKRGSLGYVISWSMGIDKKILQNQSLIRSTSIARRMSWASGRITTRPEDMAYCLLGLFDINMPLLYGEGGPKAFLRLQKEVVQVYADHTIFCWHWTKDVPSDWTNLLAPSPAVFAEAGDYEPQLDINLTSAIKPYSLTNLGLSMELGVLRGPQLYFVILNARKSHEIHTAVAIPMERTQIADQDWFSRSRWPPEPLVDMSYSSIQGISDEHDLLSVPHPLLKLFNRPSRQFLVAGRAAALLEPPRHMSWPLPMGLILDDDTCPFILPLLDMPSEICEGKQRIFWHDYANTSGQPLFQLQPLQGSNWDTYLATWFKIVFQWATHTWDVLVMVGKSKTHGWLCRSHAEPIANSEAHGEYPQLDEKQLRAWNDFGKSLARTDDDPADKGCGSHGLHEQILISHNLVRLRRALLRVFVSDDNLISDDLVHAVYVRLIPHSYPPHKKPATPTSTAHPEPQLRTPVSGNELERALRRPPKRKGIVFESPLRRLSTQTPGQTVEDSPSLKRTRYLNHHQDDASENS